MKDLGIIIWLTQLGISVVCSLVGCVLVSIWLRNRFGLGSWVVIVGIVLGVAGAVGSLKDALKAMDRHVKQNKPEDEPPPPVSFNEHI